MNVLPYCFELWEYFVVVSFQIQSDLLSDDIIEFTAIFIGQ